MDNSRIEIPETETLLDISLGYEGSPLLPMGTFIADGCSATKETISLKCSRYFASGGLSNYGSISFKEDVSLGSLASAVAGNIKLELDISQTAKTVKVNKCSQNQESYRNFLARICADAGCFYKQNGNTLVIRKRGEGEKHKVFHHELVKSYNFEKSQTNKSCRFQASYFDFSELQDVVVSVGNEGPVKKVSGSFKTREEALNACQMQCDKTKKNQFKLTFALIGRPEIRGDSTIEVSGFGREGIDHYLWSVDKVEHNIGQEAFITRLTLCRITKA